MSKLLGEKLVMQNQWQAPVRMPVEIQKRQYICRKCLKTFPHYQGVKLVAPGIAYCEEHKPALKPKS